MQTVDKRFKTVILPVLLFVAGILLYTQLMAQPEGTSANPPDFDLKASATQFFLGVAGAMAMYFYWFKTQRLGPALNSVFSSEGKKKLVQTKTGFKKIVPEWSLLAYDFFISILLGGFVAVFAASSGSWKEAILLGCTWNSFLSGLSHSDSNGNAN